MSGASFIYPPDGNFSAVAPSGLINYFDTLEITYTSSWSALNLTLFCLIGDSSSDYGVWQAPGNPLAASGTYRLTDVALAGFTIKKFPAPCSFKLTQYGDNSVAEGGDNFEVVSQTGTSTTYSSTASPAPSSSSSSSTSTTLESSTTQSQSISTTQTATTESTSTTASASRAAGTSATNSSSAPSSTSSAGTLTAGHVSQQEAGLSTGAKAGIGIGIAVAVLAILALCVVVFRLRRKINRSIYKSTLR